MINDSNNLEELTDHLKDYIQTNIDIVRLDASGRLAKLSSTVISSVIIGFIVNLFIICISIGAGFYFGSLLGNTFTGFFIVAGIYFLLILILYFSRNKLLINPIRNAIVGTLLEEHKSE
jgi:hypothetical protein